jgi:hypothetical protein
MRLRRDPRLGRRDREDAVGRSAEWVWTTRTEREHGEEEGPGRGRAGGGAREEEVLRGVRGEERRHPVLQMQNPGLKR